MYYGQDKRSQTIIYTYIMRQKRINTQSEGKKERERDVKVRLVSNKERLGWLFSDDGAPVVVEMTALHGMGRQLKGTLSPPDTAMTTT